MAADASSGRLYVYTVREMGVVVGRSGFLWALETPVDDTVDHSGSRIHDDLHVLPGHLSYPVQWKSRISVCLRVQQPREWVQVLQHRGTVIALRCTHF